MLKAGDVIDNWEIVGKLGEGGMGAVYRARNRIVSEMEAAIKVSRPTDFKQARARFEREVMALLRLQHPSVVRIQGVGEDSERGMLWFAMDLVEGEPLEDVLDRGPMPLQTALPMFIALCDGLAHAHERGVAHRDLKPANIIVRPNGQPVLVDFGISAAIDADKLTKTGMVVGTPQYLPPEALDGKLDDPSVGDIYAIGQMLVEAIDGKAAFPFDPNMTSTQNALRIMHNKVATGPLSPDMHVPPDLRSLLARSTEPAPPARLQSIAELAEGLRQVAEKNAITVWVSTMPKASTPPAGSPYKAAHTPKPTLVPGGTSGETSLPTMALPTAGTDVGTGETPTSKKRGGGLLVAGAGAAVLLTIGGLVLGGGAIAAVVAAFVLLREVPPDPGAIAGADTDAPRVATTTPPPDDTDDAVVNAGTEGRAEGGQRGGGQGSGGVDRGSPEGGGSGTPEGGSTDGGGSPDQGTEAGDPDVDSDTEADTEADTQGDVEPDTQADVEPDTQADVEPDTEAAPVETEPEGGTDAGGSSKRPSIRPDWSSVLGITKGMSDNQLKAHLGPAKSGSGRYCRSGEGAKSFRNGTITVCRGLVGGAKRVFVAKGVDTSGLPGDPKLAVLGKSKAEAVALIGAPGADRGDLLRYNYGYAKLYMGGDEVIGVYVEL